MKTKKLLSMLLALTLVMSVVVIPTTSVYAVTAGQTIDDGNSIAWPWKGYPTTSDVADGSYLLTIEVVTEDSNNVISIGTSDTSATFHNRCKINGTGDGYDYNIAWLPNKDNAYSNEKGWTCSDADGNVYFLQMDVKLPKDETANKMHENVFIVPMEQGGGRYGVAANDYVLYGEGKQIEEADLGAWKTIYIPLSPFGFDNNNFGAINFGLINTGVKAAATKIPEYKFYVDNIKTIKYAPVTNAHLASTTASSATIEWGASADAESYDIIRNDGTDDTVLTGKTSPFTDEGLAEGTYTYKVRVNTAEGLTYDSAEINATISDLVAPIVESVAWNDNFEGVYISFLKPSGTFTGYKLYRDGVLIQTLPDPERLFFVDGSVENNTTYTYKLSTYNGEAESTLSDGYEITITHVAAPTSFESTLNAEGKAVLTWDEVTGATGYVVYKNGVALPEITTNTYIDTDVVAVDTAPAGYYVTALKAVVGDSAFESVPTNTLWPLKVNADRSSVAYNIHSYYQSNNAKTAIDTSEANDFIVNGTPALKMVLKNTARDWNYGLSFYKPGEFDLITNNMGDAYENNNGYIHYMIYVEGEEGDDPWAPVSVRLVLKSGGAYSNPISRVVPVNQWTLVKIPFSEFEDKTNEWNTTTNKTDVFEYLHINNFNNIYISCVKEGATGTCYISNLGVAYDKSDVTDFSQSFEIDGSVIPSLADGTVTVKLTATTEENKVADKDAFIIVASYVGDKLKTATAEPVKLSTLTPEKAYTYTKDIEVTNDVTSVRAFVFDGLTYLKPLTTLIPLNR